MKKFLLSLCCLFVAINVVKLFMPNSIPSDISEIYKYCKQNGYSTDYCYLVDFCFVYGAIILVLPNFVNRKVQIRSYFFSVAVAGVRLLFAGPLDIIF